MEGNILPKAFTRCVFCDAELVFTSHATCPHCHEEFNYDFSHNVWRNHGILDIRYEDPVSGILSNLFRHPFRMKDGILYNSVEAFLRGLCWTGNRVTLEREIAPLYGMDAYHIRYVLPDWRETQLLRFNGREIPRESEDYQALIRTVYATLYEQSAIFRAALLKTRGKVLMHSAGKHDPQQTLLTEEEFITMLNEQRLRAYRQLRLVE